MPAARAPLYPGFIPGGSDDLRWAGTSKAALLLAPLLAFVPLAPALAVSSTLVRLGTDTEGAVTRVAAATVNDERLVTVTTDSSSNLQVTAFDVTANGKFTKRGSASAGQTAAFAVAGLSMPSLVLGGTNVVTAVKAQNGTLELIDWFVDAGGSVLREGSIAAGPITQLAVAPVGSGRVVTLTQDSTGSTKLIAWGACPRRDSSPAAATSRSVPGTASSR